MTRPAAQSEPYVERHPVSGRAALLEEDGDSCWLYLTAPGDAHLVADCWLYNCRVFERAELRTWDRSRPPPAPRELVGPAAVFGRAQRGRLTLRWSTDGGAVAALLDGQPLGYIAPDTRRGCHRALAAAGPWGAPFDEDQYGRLFGAVAPPA